jgi:iron complex outermembrane recepter protein
MKTQASLRQAVRLSLAGAVALSAALPLAPAFAQQQGQDEPQEVVVTGSRIARGSDFESPSPIVTVDRDSIERTGYANLQQLMEKVPINGNGAFSTRGNNQDSTANGASSISLRGLGADATLVLVNGRRVAISAFAENVTTNFVDINSIPVAAIERVEVLKDGSSAVYGSDAVAGVVNIILRKDFEGFETAGGFGSTSGGDYEESSISAIWGTSGEDSNVTMIFDYFKNTSLFNSERGNMGSANQSALGGFDLRSSRGFPGAFSVNGGLPQADPGCAAANVAVDPGDNATDPSDDSSVCVYDFGPWNVLIPEAERTGVMLLARQGLGEDAEVFAEVALQHNTSLAQGAPTPLDNSAGLTIPASHPNNPYGNVSSIDIFRLRTVDAGARQWDIETDNLRGVLGMRGALNEWTWEVSAQRARSESEQTGDRSQGWVRTDFLQAEINAGRYNPFGGVQNPQSVINAITTSLVRRGESRFTSYDAQISGELFDLPADAVRMAAGVEYREESVADTPDDQFQRGLIFGTESVSAAASRDVAAAFVEFAVPVLENLELSLAARYDDYSDFGGTTNPKIAARWEPIETLAVRASWGTGFRAPSLAQIGLGPSQESQFFGDPFRCGDDCPRTDYNIIFSGNPELDAEESESFNVGAAWRAVEGLELTLDFWDITQENKIDEEPFGLVYQRECNNQNSTVCVRGAPLGGETLGPLISIATSFTNIGEQSANGVDLGAYFRRPVAVGDLTLGFTYTRLLDFERIEADGNGVLVSRALEGEYEYPEDRVQLSGDWNRGDWGVFASVDYIGSFQDSPDADLDGVLDYDQVDTRDVDAFTTLNLQLRYTGIENVRLLLGVDNAFDEDPPFAIGDGDTDLYGYAQNVHNPRGRFWNARAIFNF